MSTTQAPVNRVLVGRQAIFDAKKDVFGYELLYRHSHDANEANFADGDVATARTMLNALLELGLDRIVGPHMAFINLTTGFILGQCCEEFPKDRVVLEVLEDVQVNDEIIAALTHLAEQGYCIALDDFAYRDDLDPLVKLAHMVKLDVLSLSREALAEHVALLRRYPVKLLAEKVETHDDFAFCHELGFDYFQGYFFCRPSIVQGATIPANQGAILSLLSKLQDPQTAMEELEDIIRRDLALSHKVLKYVNSAFFSLPRTVDSIRQAACMVGAQRLKTWATLITLASMGDKPFELLVTALIRARMAELLAVQMRAKDPDQYFTVGMFSVLESLFDQPLAQLLEEIHLSPDVTGALLAFQGPMGETLKLVIAYDQGEWNSLILGKLDETMIRDAYLDAVEWMTSLVPLLDE